MAKFKCRCGAEVEKEMSEAPGCPCCGYGKEGLITINPFPTIQPIWVVPYWQGPYTPWPWGTETTDGTGTFKWEPTYKITLGDSTSETGHYNPYDCQTTISFVSN